MKESEKPDHQQIVEEMKAHVSQVIQETVNGKIDAQRAEWKRFMESFYKASQVQVKANQEITKKLDDYIKTDNAWKKEADPYIKGLANLSGTAKIVVWLAVGISSLGGAWLVIKNLFHR